MHSLLLSRTVEIVRESDSFSLLLLPIFLLMKLIRNTITNFNYDAPD